MSPTEPHPSNRGIQPEVVGVPIATLGSIVHPATKDNDNLPGFRSHRPRDVFDSVSMSSELRQSRSRLRVRFLFLLSLATALPGRGHRAYGLDLRRIHEHVRRCAVAAVALAPLHAAAIELGDTGLALCDTNFTPECLAPFRSRPPSCKDTLLGSDRKGVRQSGNTT